MSYQCLSATIANNQDKNTVFYAFEEIETVPSTISLKTNLQDFKDIYEIKQCTNILKTCRDF